MPRRNTFQKDRMELELGLSIYFQGDTDRFHSRVPGNDVEVERDSAW